MDWVKRRNKRETDDFMLALKLTLLHIMKWMKNTVFPLVFVVYSCNRLIMFK